MTHFRMLFDSIRQNNRWQISQLVTTVVLMMLCMAQVQATGLSVDEHQQASDLASKQAWQQTRSTIKSQPHPLNIQTLSIELEERKKGTQLRRAKVYQFNYHTQRSRLVLIDLNTKRVVEQKLIDSVHLPLNQNEINTARIMVEQHASIMSQLNGIRQQRGLETLNDLSSIEVKASIFEPDDTSHDCANKRCALISLFDQTRTVFSVEPLVNLQSLTITTLQQSL